jgi:hypothetical protein
MLKLTILLHTLFSYYSINTDLVLTTSRLDFTGIYVFWEIVEQLAQDKHPSTKQWDLLFGTPGYTYLEQESGRELLMDRFKTAYMPSMSSNREEVLSKGGYQSIIINHLVSLYQNKVELIQFADSLKRQQILENALGFTKVYLPEDYINTHPHLSPPIAFAFFEPDGKANGEIIVVDLAFARKINLNLFLAHEAHHFFMANIKRKMKDASNENDQYLLRTIKRLHLEGIADLIDKKEILKLPEDITEEDHWYEYNYRKYYNLAPNTLSRVDSLISNTKHSEYEGLGKTVWSSFHFGTHPEALHMALLIERSFGIERILSVLDNPFEFLESSQKAALKNPEEGWIFSNKPMSYFRQLERIYLVKD